MIQDTNKYPTANKLDFAATIINAQSRLESVPNETRKRLQALGLLTSARDQVACGELLTHTEMRRLNKAFDDLTNRNGLWRGMPLDHLFRKRNLDPGRPVSKSQLSSNGGRICLIRKEGGGALAPFDRQLKK
jgi:hypothetical protein